MYLLGVITYNEFIKLVTEKKMKDIVHYLEKLHKTKPNKRTRDSSTAFLDPYEHIDFKPLFESLADRLVDFPSNNNGLIFQNSSRQEPGE